MFDEREEGEYVREDLRGKGIRVFGIFFWLGFSFLFYIVFLSRLFFWLGDFVGLFFCAVGLFPLSLSDMRRRRLLVLPWIAQRKSTLITVSVCFTNVTRIDFSLLSFLFSVALLWHERGTSASGSTIR
jgi:hypothetical protein